MVFSCAKPCFDCIQIAKRKDRHAGCALWKLVGGVWGEFDPVHFRWSYLNVDLYDMRSTNRLIDVICCDVTLQLHLPSTESPIRYLVDSGALIFPQCGAGFWTVIKRRGLKRARDLIRKNFTTHALTIKLIFARWGGVDSLNDFAGHLSQVEES